MNLTEETKKKISKARQGIKFTAEHRKRLSESHRGIQARENHPRWNGGRQMCARGYIRILLPNHPYADRHGYVLEHRLVMEAHLGRVLLPTEVCHHINGIRNDNRIENLMLFSSHGEHMKFEATLPGYICPLPKRSGFKLTEDHKRKIGESNRRNRLTKKDGMAQFKQKRRREQA